MGRKKIQHTRVHGPHYERGRWRVIIRTPEGARACSTFASEVEAREFADGAREEFGADEVVALEAALDRYEQYLAVKGNRETTIAVTMARLRRFASTELETPMPSLTPRKAARLYKSYAEAKRPDGKPAHSVDTHRNALAEAKTFARWAVRARLIGASPFDGVEGVGARKRGKPQLRVDELRALAAHAHRLSRSADRWRADGAIAILIALYLGLRASEVTGLRVRDLDDDGHLLWVAAERGKTAAARRLVEVPHQLRPLLMSRADRRARDEYLLPADDVVGQDEGSQRHWRDWVREAVQRECDALGIPSVTAHSLRGAVATLAASAGVVGQIVADQLGHESYGQTEAAYAAPGAAADARRRAGLRVLAGDRGERSAQDIRPISVPSATVGGRRK